MNEFVKERQKREGARKEVGGGAVRRLRRAGFAFEAERGGSGSAAVSAGGVAEVGEGIDAGGAAESMAEPAAVSVLAAHAAEVRRAVAADRGIGDKAKVELMRKRSEARATQ